MQGKGKVLKWRFLAKGKAMTAADGSPGKDHKKHFLQQIFSSSETSIELTFWTFKRIVCWVQDAASKLLPCWCSSESRRWPEYTNPCCPHRWARWRSDSGSIWKALAIIIISEVNQKAKKLYVCVSLCLCIILPSKKIKYILIFTYK